MQFTGIQSQGLTLQETEDSVNRVTFYNGMAMIKAFSGQFGFLSNFYPSEICVLAKVFPTVEHSYQALKTMDEEWIEKIRTATTPGKAKRLGSKAPVRKDWELIRIPVMEFLLKIKFSVPALKESLLATGAQELVEKNYWHDTFWGVCSCSGCGPGENYLGKLLMKIRSEMQNKGSYFISILNLWSSL